MQSDTLIVLSASSIAPDNLSTTRTFCFLRAKTAVSRSKAVHTSSTPPTTTLPRRCRMRRLICASLWSRSNTDWPTMQSLLRYWWTSWSVRRQPLWESWFWRTRRSRTTTTNSATPKRAKAMTAMCRHGSQPQHQQVSGLLLYGLLCTHRERRWLHFHRRYVRRLQGICPGWELRVLLPELRCLCKGCQSGAAAEVRPQA